MTSFSNFFIVEAQGLSLVGISEALEGFLNNVLLVSIFIAFCVFVWNIAAFIIDPSKDKDFKSRIIGGVFALFVLMSIYGFIILLRIILSP